MKKIILASLLAASVSATAFAVDSTTLAAAHHRSGNGHYPVQSIVINGNNGGSTTCAWQDATRKTAAGWYCNGDASVVKSVEFIGKNDSVTCTASTSSCSADVCEVVPMSCAPATTPTKSSQ